MELSAILTLIAILVALFGKEIVAYLKRPIFELSFDVGDVGNFHEALFPLFTHGGQQHYSKGMNCLIKISNQKRKRLFFITSETAKGCEVKVTYILHNNNKFTYYPTWLKWSGVKEEQPVSIMSGSHHYLDFINFYNFENDLWLRDKTIPMGVKRSAIHPSTPPAEWSPPDEKLYFKLCIPEKDMAINKCFFTGGTYQIHIMLNAENCDPCEFVATLKWSRSKWDKVELTIERVQDQQGLITLKSWLQNCIRIVKKCNIGTRKNKE